MLPPAYIPRWPPREEEKIILAERHDTSGHVTAERHGTIAAPELSRRDASGACESIAQRERIVLHKKIYAATHKLVFNTLTHTHASLLLTCVSSSPSHQPVHSGCASFHCRISPRSAKFCTNFLFGSLAFEIGSVCLVRSHFEMHSRS